MLSNGGILAINDYPVIGDLFKGVQVAVAWFIWMKDYSGNTKYTRIENKKIVLEQNLDIDIDNFIIYKSAISKSIISKLNIKNKWAEQYNTRSYPFMDQRKFENLDCSCIKTEEYNIAIMTNDENTVYTTIDNFKNTYEVLNYKVVCGVIINEAFENKPGNVLTNIQALGPYSVSSYSWSLIAVFENKEEAINCKKYIYTKFVKFLCNQTVNNRSNVTDNTFQFVPIQNFTQSSDIDWEQPISDIDKQLYKKYKLSQEEINYIETTIKSVQ